MARAYNIWIYRYADTGSVIAAFTVKYEMEYFRRTHAFDPGRPVVLEKIRDGRHGGPDTRETLEVFYAT